ncbi:siderophore-interacting protein [Roseicyclus sp. F158]|uniref:Siderophore-interacting protein n=1 Tax=Tropicimonas omnivorans TaxID=3075590 RepID=A0ABU3DEK9_9RHOB|nr:siderophore-interacting protein [Roseicyclus sp. F158]MDT0681988.1 siderophore-interacting protein [Roseicyclus sp. F158]
MPVTTRRVRHEVEFRRLSVLSNTRITPRMTRIVLHGTALEGFTSPGFDDHVKCIFPEPGKALPEPVREDGKLSWPDGMPPARDYTPRAHDPVRQELVIDFVVHEGGVASDWAMRAEPGDVLGIGGPRGSFLVEGEADWHLLMGDATALPAIARRIEELPRGARVMAVIEVVDAAEEQVFETEATLDTTWLHTAKGQSLSQYLKGLALPDGEGFAFFAAEAGVVAEARATFDRLGLPSDSYKAANYWRENPVAAE